MKLHARLTVIFTLMATLILALASIIVVLEVHYHFEMFKMDVPNFAAFKPLVLHFERAVLGSILWTSLGVFLLVCLLSYVVARKLSRPLVDMRKAAEEMTKGDLKIRVHTKGNDELQELAHSLNRLASQLEEQELARVNMTSDIAHELRTPLTTLKSHIEAMVDGVFEITTERLHSFREEIERLISLVEDLEQLTAYEAPDFSLTKEREDIGKVIQQSIDTIKESFNRKGVELYFKECSCYLPFDRNRLIQVFLNVLTNALKFTPKGGTVTVETQIGKEDIQIIIKDTGIGMGTDEANRVFERFYRTEKSRNRRYGGSGIGLTIAKQLIDAHQGNIWIESMPGKGSCVYIALPLQEK